MMRSKIFFWPVVIVLELVWVGIVVTIATEMELKMNPMMFAIICAPVVLFYRFGKE